MNPQHIVYLGIVLVGIGVTISAIDPLKPDVVYPQKLDVNVDLFGIPKYTEKQCIDSYEIIYAEINTPVSTTDDFSFYQEQRFRNNELEHIWGEDCYWIPNGLKMILDLDSIDDAVNNGFTDADKIRDGCYANKEHSICYGQVWIDRHANYFKDGYYTYD